MVTSDIPPVSGNSNAIKRLSSVRYFPQRSYWKELVLCPHEKPLIKCCIAIGIKTDKNQPKKFCIHEAFTQVSKLGMQPEILPSLA